MRKVRTSRARRAWDAYRRAEAARVARIEDTPAEPLRMPAWAALVALLPLLGLAAWAVDGVAVPALADLVRSGPALAAALVALVGCATFALDALPVLKPRTRVEVLYHREPSWLPGETTPERDERLNSGRAAAPGSWYPDSGPGRVISVRDIADVASGRLPSLRNMADRDRPCVTLDLTAAEIAGLASRRRKVATTNDVPCREEGSDVLGALGGEAVVVPLTLEDRLGATLAPLVEKYGSRAAVEVAEQAADFERREAELVPEVRHEPHTFTLEVERLRKALPPTVTHTGTGLYSVKVTPTHSDDTQSGAPVGQEIELVTGGLGILDAWKGGYVTNATRSETRAIVSHVDDAVTLEGVLTNWLTTDDLDVYDAWSTWPAAHDQLVVDQGSTTFTAKQYLSGYDGTYAETITLNANLAPTEVYPLLIGPAAGQTGVVFFQPAAGSSILVLSSVEGVIVSGITFTFAPNSATVYAISFMGYGFRCLECTFNVTATSTMNTTRYLSANATILFRDCVVNVTGTLSYFGREGRTTYVRCQLHNAIILASPPVQVEGCLFDGSRLQVNDGGASSVQADLYDIKHCTFYGGTNAVQTAFGTPNLRLRVRNCIFQGITEYVFNAIGGPAVIESDFNSFYDCAKIARVKSTDYTTLADWQAFVDEDGNSPDANSIFTDPLLADPAGGDFSLAAGSPCLNAGMGSGVVTGSNGVDFDPHHPDIGAWSSGAVRAPAWAGDDSGLTATDSATDGEVALAWDAATQDAGCGIGYVAEHRVASPPGEWTEAGRTNGLACAVTGLTNDVARDFRVRAWTRVSDEPAATPSDTASATPTRPTVADAPGLAVSAAGLAVTAALTGVADVTYRVRVESATAQEDEEERIGPGPVALTASSYGRHRVHAWAVGAGAARSEPSLVRDVFLHESTSEWKKAAAAIASHVEAAAGSVKVVLPRQRFDPKSVSEFIEVGKPRFEAGSGRRAERRTDFACHVLCTAKVDGNLRNLARAEELADVVEDALTDADIEIESGAWLRLHKAEVSGEGFDEEGMRQVVRVSVTGIYEREG